MASKTLVAGTISRRTGAPVPLGERDDRRQKPALVVGRRARLQRRIVGDIDADDANGHHDDVAIAGRLKRRRQMCEQSAGCGPRPADCPDGPRPDEADVSRRYELELVEPFAAAGARRHRALGHDEERDQAKHEAGPGERRGIAGKQDEERRGAHQGGDQPEPHRPFAAAPILSGTRKARGSGRSRRSLSKATIVRTPLATRPMAYTRASHERDRR